MAPRTPRHPQGAGPFVTLSIPKASVSRLSLNNVNESVSVPPKSVIATGKNAKAISNSSSKSDREFISSITTPATTPSQRRKKPAQGASPKSNFLVDDTSFLVGSSKFDENFDDHDGNEISVPPVRLHSRSQAKFSKKGDTDLLDGNTERRSSTASLTDSATRLSHRNRRLTSKAQALAGTNFLPSLNLASDVESLSSPTLVEPMNESVGAEVHDKVTDNVGPETPDTSFNEPPVESVETPTVRTSARQRKPTARAIELEIVKTSHKRPASPATSERSYKMAKNSPSTSTKPSRLRHSAVDVDRIAGDNAERNSVEESALVEENTPKLLDQEERPTQKVPKSPPARKTNSRAVKKKAANGLPYDEFSSKKQKKFNIADQYEEETSTRSSSPLWSPKLDDRTAEQIEADNKRDLLWLEAEFPPQSPEHAENSPSEEVTAAQATNPGEGGPKCDLSCLTPSKCLLAFAKLAADLSDSDSDISMDDEEILRNDIDIVNGQTNFTAIHDTLGVLGALRPTHCQCPNGTTQPSINPPWDLQAEREKNATSQNSPSRMNKANENFSIPRSEKSCELRQQPVVSELKRQRMNEEKPPTIRQGSSFEQRMQADYISSQNEKTKALSQNSGHLVNWRTNPSNVEKFLPPATFSPKPIRFEVNGNHTDTIKLQAESQIPGSTAAVFKTNHEPLGHSSSAKARASKLEHRHGSADAKSKAGATAGNKAARASGKPSVAKSSAAGSVRASLQGNKTGQKKDPATKQSQSGIPPPPTLQTSIKLRFNMSSR